MSAIEDHVENVVCKRFLEVKEDIRWFVDKYFPNKMLVLEEMAKENKGMELFNQLNDVWFHLPDNVFNIMENPKGWDKFLSLVEV